VLALIIRIFLTIFKRIIKINHCILILYYIFHIIINMNQHHNLSEIQLKAAITGTEIHKYVFIYS